MPASRQAGGSAGREPFAAGKAIREIVQEVEAEWEQQLGPRDFAQLRDLLTKLYAITTAAQTPADRLLNVVRCALLRGGPGVAGRRVGYLVLGVGGRLRVRGKN
jgi:hypothetical protein